MKKLLFLAVVFSSSLVSLFARSFFVFFFACACVLRALPHLIPLTMDIVMEMSGTRCVEGGKNTSLCNKREA